MRYTIGVPLAIELTPEETEQLESLDDPIAIYTFLRERAGVRSLKQWAETEGGELGYLFATLSFAERSILANYCATKHGLTNAAQRAAFRQTFLQAFEQRAAAREPDRAKINPVPAHLKESCPNCGLPWSEHETPLSW